MRIVIDTNIVVSAIFFGGKPLEVMKLVLKDAVLATATPKIIAEYHQTVDYILQKYKEKQLRIPLLQIISALDLIDDSNSVQICRDPDDDKFISCALDSCSSYILSGDKDLLVLEKYKDIKILSASDFLALL